MIFKNSKKNLLKQIVENTTPQTEADTNATVMNTKAIYENSAARKQRAAEMASNSMTDDLATQGEMALANATNRSTVASMNAAAANEIETHSEEEQLMVKAGLMSAEQLETGATVEASLADIQLAINSGKVTLAEGKQIATTLGLDASQLKAASSTKKLSAAMSLLKGTLITAAISGAIYGITKLVSWFNKGDTAVEDYIDEIGELTDEYKELSKEAEELQEKLDENVERLNELYALSEKGTISLVEQGELDKLERENELLKEQIALKEIEANNAAKDTLKKVDDIDAATALDYAVQNIEYKESGRLETDLKNAEDKVKDLEDRMYDAEAHGRTRLAETLRKEWEEAGFELAKLQVIDNSEITEGNLETALEAAETKKDAYETLLNNGYELSQKELEDYQKVKDSIQKFLLFEFKRGNDSLNMFKALSVESQRSVVKDDLVEKGLSNSLAEELANSLSEEELLKYIDSDALDRIVSKTAYTKIPGLTNLASLVASMSGEDFVKLFITELNKKEEEKAKVYSSFEDVFNADNFKEQKEELLDLAKAGELTPETLETTEEYRKLIDDTGLSAKEVKSNILDLLDATEKLASASRGTEPIISAYEEYLDKGFVTADTLEGMRETIGKQVNISDWNLFEDIVGDPTSGVQEIQKAFDDLTTAWYKSNEIMKGVTEDNKEAYIANLKENNIVNAEDVVNEVLGGLKIFEAAEDEYEVYLKNNGIEYSEYIKEKGKLDKQYFDQIGTNSKILFEKLGIAYKDDLVKWYELIAEKGKTQKELNDLVHGSYDTDKSVVENLLINKGYVSHADIADVETILARKREDDEAYNNFIAELNAKMGISENGVGLNSEELKKKSSETFDWIETKISRIQRVISNFGKTVSATWKSWEDRNDAILKQLPELEKEFSIQEQAHQYYLNEANKVGLTEKNNDGVSYAELVRNGAIDIDKVTGDELKEKISTYQDLWEKALAAEDRIIEIEGDIVGKYNEQMDLTESKFDAKINLIESRIGVIDSLIAQEEAQGHLVSKGYYETMLAEQTANRDALIEKKKQLEADFAYAIADSKANGVEITEGSEQWNEWKARIIEVESEINGLNTELLETANTMRELDWEVFDFKQERISKLTEEADYLIGLMSNEKLYDDNTGELTKYGDATAGLHATNYNVYKLQAQEYAKQIAEIDELMKQAGNEDDTKLLARRDELLESHRDMVNAAEDEKMAIRDMVEEGYNILIDSIQEIIDKNMEAKNSIKDLYDYEKSISEKTKNISSLEKKIASTEGDNSEEAQAQIQKWKVELEEAEQDLYETEWERQLSDEQKMLDGLVEDAQDWIDKRLENIDKLLSDIVANTNAESGTIATTLEGVAEKFNTPISSEIEKFFDTDNESAVSDFLKNFTDEETGVFKVVNGIKDGVDDMVKYLKDQADGNTDGNGSDGNSGNTSGGSGSNSGNNSNNTPSDTNKNPSNDKNNTKGDGKPKVGDRVIFDNGIYYSTEYGTGKTGNQMLGKEVFITKIASSGSKRYHIGRTSKHGERNLGWVDLEQLKGYYTGSKYIDEDQWAWTQEKGREVIVRKDGSVLTPLSKGDMVLNNAATETFYKLMNNPKIMEMLDSMIMPQISAGTSLPNLVNKGVNNTQSVEINLGGIQMYGVNDPEKFAVQLQHALKTDRMSEKIVQSIAWDKAMGRNSLSKHRY